MPTRILLSQADNVFIVAVALLQIVATVLSASFSIRVKFNADGNPALASSPRVRSPPLSQSSWRCRSWID
jgi:hypothetical protein